MTIESMKALGEVIDELAELDVLRERDRKWRQLVQWLALAYRITWYDEAGNEHVEWNEPVLALEDEHGDPLPVAVENKEMWDEALGLTAG